MKTIKRIIALALVVVVVFLGSCARTPQYGKGLDKAIASLEKITINNDEQHLLIRGKDTDNPILLFLHGGPGMPMMYLAHDFQKHLEEDFVVVQWDQRASGKSYKKGINKDSINIRQYMDDAKAVINYVQGRFGREKVILAGHSWGSYLGTLLVHEYPELFQAYIGIGQVVDDQEALGLQKVFLEKSAIEAEDEKAQLELKEHGTAIYEKYLFKYGAELKNSKNFMPFVWSGFKSPEYTWKDVMNVAKGSGFCSTNMKYNVIEGSLWEEKVFSFEVPMFYFTGRYDYTTPFPLIERYFEQIEAPQKELVWFEDSAHFPFFEEPEKFSEAMRSVKFQISQTQLEVAKAEGIRQ